MRRAFAKNGCGCRVRGEVPEEWSEETEVCLAWAGAKQIGAGGKDRLEQGKCTQIQIFDLRRRCSGDAVLLQEDTPLSPQDDLPAQEEWPWRIAEHCARELRAHQPGVFGEGPAIVERRTPEPFVKQVFQQKTDEGGSRLYGL